VSCVPFFGNILLFIWLFAGMTDRTVFGIMMSQLGLNGKESWAEYSNLRFRDILLIDYSAEGTLIKIINA
jgi:hypothetical protein